MQKPISDAAIGPAKFWLHPLLHLLGEGTLRAVGVVLQAKVLVDLKQTLLVRQCAEKLPPARIITKKPRGAGFDASVREARR